MPGRYSRGMEDPFPSFQKSEKSETGEYRRGQSLEAASTKLTSLSNPNDRRFLVNLR
jgi:hypothetical protein